MDNQSHYVELAAAFVRGRIPALAPIEPVEALLQAGADAGLRLHKFKRTASLPRVRRVMGMIAGLDPQSLLDVGSGRGAFLWPLLDAFPTVEVTAIDLKPQRVSDLRAVRDGGVTRLRAMEMDAAEMSLPDASVDGATLLEVLEHMPEPARALKHAMRVARRFVIVSVPSKEDDNPEHIHLFDKDSVEAMLAQAGATRVHVEYVLNHMVALGLRG